MSSYVFQFFCGDGKVGTRGSGQQGREMLSLQAPPPRPRPSSAPMRPLHSSGEHNESRFEQPVVRDRRRRAHSRSVSRHRHRRARSPRRRRRSRTSAERRDPVPRRAIGTQPRLRWFRHHGLFYLTNTTCHHPGKSTCTLRQDGFQRICNGQLRLFHRIHSRSSLKGQQMFNRSSDHQCRAANRPSLTCTNRLCH